MSFISPRRHRIVVFRALQLGDMLCAVPALRALRERFPDAEITLVGLPWARSFVTRFDAYIDDFVEFPGFPGMPERPVDVDALSRFLDTMRERRYDLAVQLHGSGDITNGLVHGFGAKRVIGFHPPLAPPSMSGEFHPYPESGHEIRRALSLVERLGARVDDVSLEFPLRQEDFDELAQWPALAALPRGEYVCLHAGARSVTKRWPPARFAAVGDALAARGFAVVLTGHTVERPITQAVADAMRAPAIDAACDISVGGLGALLSGARAVVSNDTGVAHLVAALHIPSVVVFFATDPTRWAPLDTRLHRTLYEPGGPQVETVLAEVDALLAPQAADAHA